MAGMIRRRLESDLRTQHLSLDVTRTSVNAYGVVYEIEGPIETPGGRIVRFCSIWQVDTGTEVPRFITMLPEVGMPFDMYGDVILTRDITERGLRAGDVGTVVERHAVPGVSVEGYSVEFFDMTGNTVAVVTLPASALRPPTPADRPAVRALSA